MYELAPPSFPTPEQKWQQTLLGRAVVGLMLCQGLYYALWQMCSFVVVLLPFEGLAAVWSKSPPEGWVWWVLLVVQAISLLAGGMMVGAGHRRGILLGFALGLVNSFIFLASQWFILQRLDTYQSLTAEALYGQTILQFVCGGIGGLLGSIIWKPVVQIIGPAPSSPQIGMNLTRLHGTRRWFRPFRGPIAWLRVGIGTTVAVFGCLYASYILRTILDNLNRTGAAQQPTVLHHLFVTWELSILFVIIGTAWAGSNTKNGPKQGLIVGFLATVLLTALQVLGRIDDVTVTPAILMKYFFRFKLDMSGFPWMNDEQWNLLLMTLITVLPISLVGGWFGSQLLPPLIRPPRQGGGGKRPITAPA
jgi:hypothetical protein